jgi:glycosyltransferase involved in cell wall biosynthesis
MDKKLLIVSYHFPPIVSAGVSRIVGLARHLKARGWNVSVVTVEKSYAERSERASLARIPEDVSVFRTATYEVDRYNPRFLLCKDGVGETGNARASSVRRLLAGVLKPFFAVLHPLLSYPDRQVGWFVPLIRQMRMLLASGGYKLVLSSSPPHSTQLPLVLLKRIRAFHWFADFRDPWTAPPIYGKRTIGISISVLLEKLVLKSCDRVIANTEGNRDALLKAFPVLSKEKVVVVTNGFDENAIEEVEAVSQEEVNCDLMYTGELYEGMLELYTKAVSLLKEKGGAPRLFVYGSVGSSVLENIEKYGLGDCIVLKGEVSYAKSVSLMRKAKSLLLTVAHNARGATWVPSKLYAYLFSGKPILAIAPEGDAAKIVRETGAGEAVTSRDPAEVAGAISDFMRKIDEVPGFGVREYELIEKYSMGKVASDMEDVLLSEV